MKLLLIENPTNQIINIIRKTINNNQRSLIAAEAILQADPTPKKKYIKWLANILKKGHIKVNKAFSPPNPQIILPEDSHRVHQVINTFEKAKPRLPYDQRNILSFKDFYTLEDLLDKLVSTAQVKTGGMVKNIPGAEVIYNRYPYTIYKVKKIRKIYSVTGGSRSEEENQRIKAIEVLGMGPPETKWCTRSNYSANSMASHYLARSDMFVVYKNGVPFAQKCGSELRDVNDRETLPHELQLLFDEIQAREIREKLRLAKQKYSHMNNIIMSVNSDSPITYKELYDFGKYYAFIPEDWDKKSSHYHTISNKKIVDLEVKYGLARHPRAMMACRNCGIFEITDNQYHKIKDWPKQKRKFKCNHKIRHERLKKPYLTMQKNNVIFKK